MSLVAECVYRSQGSRTCSLGAAAGGRCGVAFYSGHHSRDQIIIIVIIFTWFFGAVSVVFLQ